jgi:hypothetical protein
MSASSRRLMVRRLHDSRRTAACLWLTHGVDLSTVSAWLGRTSISTTNRYLHYLGTAADTAGLERLNRARGAPTGQSSIGRSSVRLPETRSDTTYTVANVSKRWEMRPQLRPDPCGRFVPNLAERLPGRTSARSRTWMDGSGRFGP